ncbi:MAG: LytTR family transcriptional regulator DNA-binding domain-containing protein [Clostridia bacterium]|nr:LytTR family transcriptional regulator DNA-binding domain-containing protein [Clostridia bacterium]
MRIRTELADTDEIVIRCRERNSKIRAVEEAIADVLRGDSEIVLLGDGREHFVPKSDVLYFESFDGKVYAHTADEVYTAPYKLFELESIMPPTFIRVSKSAIANIGKISSLRRELVGNGEMTFKDSDKKVYFSRAYYKLLQYRINEMRLEK